MATASSALGTLAAGFVAVLLLRLVPITFHLFLVLVAVLLRRLVTAAFHLFLVLVAVLLLRLLPVVGNLLSVLFAILFLNALLCCLVTCICRFLRKHRSTEHEASPYQ